MITLQCSLFSFCVWKMVQPSLVPKDHLCFVSCTMLPASFTKAQPKQLSQVKIYRCSCQRPAKSYSAVKLGAPSCTKEGWKGKVSTGFLLQKLDHVWKELFHPFEMRLATNLYLSLENGCRIPLHTLISLKQPYQRQ